ncbi:MAG: L-lactate dehydrogenase complex protein LldE [Bacteroidales bacterium]|jgi:L-lactate dehydrogenase complex protein LldE|nr:L-lactate dehydrogenase complex protein LldE [Bacteroidales bacterium]MDN5328952.1 L-lactate dehydrogenase complex protein LldE [Bacteroidales bacterium]
MIVDIFIPCFIDQFYPETAHNLIKILERLDIAVNYNPRQTCCGQMAFNSGFWDEARKVATKFLNDFPEDRPIITPSASCAGFIKNYYHILFHNSAQHNEYKQVKKNIYEFTDFLVNMLHVSDLGASFPHKVTYHSSCASLREYGLKNEPIHLLNNVRGIEYIPLPQADVCCGFGGTFSVKFEPISTAMAEQKIENALTTGAEYIVSTDSSCLMHLQGYIDKHQIPLKTIHIVDVLASGW